MPGCGPFRYCEPIVRLLKGGHSIHNAAKIAGKGVSTVWRVKLALKA